MRFPDECDDPEEQHKHRRDAEYMRVKRLGELPMQNVTDRVTESAARAPADSEKRERTEGEVGCSRVEESKPDESRRPDHQFRPGRHDNADRASAPVH
jgi:protein required for attachment to host cells